MALSNEPRMCAHSTFASPCTVNLEFFEDYLLGLSNSECFQSRIARLVGTYEETMSEQQVRQTTGLDEYRNPTLPKFQGMLMSDIEDHYRMFHYLSSHLKDPRKFMLQCPAPIGIDTKRVLLSLYYRLDPLVGRQLFGTLKDVEEIAAAVRKPPRTVQHMVDCVKVIHRALTQGRSASFPDTPVTFVEQRFQLPSPVALQFTYLSFSITHGIDTTHEMVASMSFEALLEVVGHVHAFCHRNSSLIPDALYQQLADLRTAWKNREPTMSACSVAVLKIVMVVSKQRSIRMWLSECAERLGHFTQQEVAATAQGLRVPGGPREPSDSFLRGIVETHNLIRLSAYSLLLRNTE